MPFISLFASTYYLAHLNEQVIQPPMLYVQRLARLDSQHTADNYIAFLTIQVEMHPKHHCAKRQKHRWTIVEAECFLPQQARVKIIETDVEEIKFTLYCCMTVYCDYVHS